MSKKRECEVCGQRVQPERVRNCAETDVHICESGSDHCLFCHEEIP